MLPIVAGATFVAALMYLTTVCTAQAVSNQKLLALSKTNHILAIMHPVTLKIMARIPVGVDTHEVVASLDERTVYLCIYGGDSLHEINVIDLVTQNHLLNIDTRPLFGPHDITFVNGKAWFTAEGSKSVSRYETVTGKLYWI